MKDWARKALTRILLVAYALFLLKPVMPLLSDAIAHTFWRSVHIAVVHRVNGKEHVHYELRKAAADSEKDKAGQKPSSSSEEDAYSLPFTATVDNTKSRPLRLAMPTAYYLRIHHDADITLESPPPKWASASCCQ